MFLFHLCGTHGYNEGSSSFNIRAKFRNIPVTKLMADLPSDLFLHCKMSLKEPCYGFGISKITVCG
jgi:hypothetical protein